jgi:hypothetical protein
MHVCTAEKKVYFRRFSKALGDEEGLDIAEYDEWEERMQQRKYVLTPMIERSGACLVVDITGPDGEKTPKLGCLIKYPEYGTQFNHLTLKYQALVDQDNTVAQVHFMETLRDLLPIGTIMYLKLDVIDDERFSRQHSNRRAKYLLTRLNVPNVCFPEQGKIFVTGLHERKRGRTQTALVTSVTFPVNPWDVVLKEMFDGNEDEIVQRLE